MFICPKKSFLNFSSEGDGFSKPAKSSNSKPSKDLLDLDFGNPVAQPPPPQRTGNIQYGNTGCGVFKRGVQN